MPTQPPADGQHVVQDGEWVASIALRYGYADWDKDIWQHGDNQELRDLRKDPHVLAPGDILHIPSFEEKYESGATEQRHKFVLKVPSEVLRVRLLKPDGTPLKDTEYLLQITCDPGGGIYKQKNKKTTDKGMVEEEIPSTATEGLLRLKGLKQTLRLQLGFLHPLDLDDKPTLLKGVQERLKWIGFDPGTIDGIDGPRTQSAVRSFQQFCKDNADKGDDRITDAGPVDGIVGPKTRAALLKYYGA